MHEQTQRNLDYYSRLSEGRSDYWRYMPAPRFRARVICDVLKAERPTSVVDLGCGDGSLLSEIRGAVPAATLAGIDLSEPQIEENRSRIPDLEWYAGNLESEQFTLPHRFAAITATELIEHLADPAHFLRALHRVGAPAALLILSTQTGRIGETEKHVGHLRHFSGDEMSALLEATGWKPVRVWNAGFPFQDLSKWSANLAPNTMMHHFGVKPYGRMQRLVSAILRILFALNSSSRGAQLFAVARRGND